MMSINIIFIICFCYITTFHALVLRPVHSRTGRQIATSTSSLKVGNFFSGLFGPKRSASAAHILVKGSNAQQFLQNLKQDLSKSKNIASAFADAAEKYSTCPSAKKGGSLGKFNQGMMVPAFDKVVFDDNNALNQIHGPVSTPFGYHLIYIEDRS